MKKMLFAAFALMASPLAAQDLTYDFDVTLDCIAGAEHWWQKQECIGAAANACMEATPGGFSTVGMSACMDAELQSWDRALNELYGPLRGRMAEYDAAEKDFPGPVARADALRDMQRAWITYRDAACDFERSKWGNGTGGGPAAVGCLMDETARQVLRLQLELSFH